jgi:hypothetical protein
LHAQAQQRFSMWHCIVAFDISNKFLSSWLKNEIKSWLKRKDTKYIFKRSNKDHLIEIHHINEWNFIAHNFCFIFRSFFLFSIAMHSCLLGLLKWRPISAPFSPIRIIVWVTYFWRTDINTVSFLFFPSFTLFRFSVRSL